MVAVRLLSLLLLVFIAADAKGNGTRTVRLIGITKSARNGKETKMEVYPDVPWSFSIFGQYLPLDGYILTSRSTCRGLNETDEDELDLKLTTLWPPKLEEETPALRRNTQMVTVRAFEGVPFNSKRTKFLICHPELQSGNHIMSVRSKHRPIDWWMCICVLVFLVCSGYCSGISIAFFTYSTDELSSIIEASIDQTEKAYAQQILWYRSKSNYLICCFAAANCTFNVLLAHFCDEIFRNFASRTVISTLVTCCITVIFGEIIPQGLGSRYGLYLASKTRHITMLLFFVMAPFAWPLSKIIDLTLGREVREVLSRDQLKKLLTHHANNLDGDQEGEILRRTVKFQDMTVRDIMKPLSDIFALSDRYKYTPDLALMLVERGMYSRIPVFSGTNCKSIYGCINMSDLLSQPKDGRTISQIMKETTSHLRFAPIDMTLQQLSDEMKTGEHHMCVVFDYRFNKNEVVGLVTSEDVWEQLFGDIQDDLDLAFGNRRTGLRKDQSTLDWYKEEGRFTCNQQLAIIQQLWNVCPEFRWMGLNVHTMRHLLPQDLQLLRRNESLDFDSSKIYIICSGEFDAEATVTSDCSTSETKVVRKFHSDVFHTGKVWVLNHGVSQILAQNYVATFPSFKTDPPRYMGKSELDRASRITARQDSSYFTVSMQDIADAIKLSAAGEDAIEYLENQFLTFLGTPGESVPRKSSGNLLGQATPWNRADCDRRIQTPIRRSERKSGQETSPLLRDSKTQVGTDEDVDEEPDEASLCPQSTQPTKSSSQKKSIR